MNDNIFGILEFIKIAEKLKTELRHSWTSNVNRQESVAEHTWSACLLAISLFDEISITLDQLRVLKMIIVHDLAEVIIGDIPAFETSKRQDEKYINEKKAIQSIASKLQNKKTSKEIVNLWNEFEERKTPEAIFAKACDKADVLLQHMNTDIKTWDEGDYGLNPYDADERFEFDPFLWNLKQVINTNIMIAIEKQGTLYKVKKRHKEMWLKDKEKIK